MTSPHRADAADPLSRFADAITHLEATSDVEPLVALYGSESLIGTGREPEAFTGLEGARRFWLRYRNQFAEIRSTYRLVAGNGQGGVLEWDSDGTVDGNVVHYRGATVLELAGDRISRSCAYFDLKALGDQVTDSGS